MVRFVSLFNFTDQGIRKFSETVSRADAFIKQIYRLRDGPPAGTQKQP